MRRMIVPMSLVMIYLCTLIGHELKGYVPFDLSLNY